MKGESRLVIAMAEVRPESVVQILASSDIESLRWLMFVIVATHVSRFGSPRAPECTPRLRWQCFVIRVERQYVKVEHT